MTVLLNDPTAFRQEMTEGFCAAFPGHVAKVEGASGVRSVGAPRAGRVAVVVGGGAGHYPAFCGLVGEGLASAAVIGDVFTSPSGSEAYHVAKAVDGGAGVLLTYGNYSGDVMNFGMAEARLRAEAVDARTVLVTDDVLSAPAAERAKRRGIAGGFFVFKVAGASAARGDDLATVARLAEHANGRTASAGVAFAGCTLPGQREPLFTVAPGAMEVGLGIHGEPGVRTSALLPAREVAALLVETLLAEAPRDAGGRVAVLVNGLGATKYEELFVLNRDVARLLGAAGLQTHETHVGEYVTALDMAGGSLSLLWLDDELAELHDAPARTPAFTRYGAGGLEAAVAVPAAATASDAVAPAPAAAPPPPAGVPGEAGRRARAALAAARAAILEAEDELGRLDAVAGDGDHGAGMARGFRAALAALEDADDETARCSWQRAGGAFMDVAGGASGALVGAWLAAVGDALPDDDADVGAPAYAAALAAGLATLMRLGGAVPGDKTMLDTLAPFGDALTAAVAAGAALRDAWAAALPAASDGMRATAAMTSRLGRAARLGERSRGSQDPGATSMFYMLRSMGEELG